MNQGIQFHECPFCQALFGESGPVTQKEADHKKSAFLGWKDCGNHIESATHCALVIYKDFKRTGEVVWILPEHLVEVFPSAKYEAGTPINIGVGFAQKHKAALIKHPIIPKRY